MWLPKTDPEYYSLRVPYSSKLLESTTPRRNIRAQNQEKWQPENCLCKTSRSGIDHSGVSKTFFYTVFQYWSNQRRKESRRYYEKFRRPKRSPPWVKNHRREFFLITTITTIKIITSITTMIIIEAIAAI